MKTLIIDVDTHHAKTLIRQVLHPVGISPDVRIVKNSINAINGILCQASAMRYRYIAMPLHLDEIKPVILPTFQHSHLIIPEDCLVGHRHCKIIRVQGKPESYAVIEMLKEAFMQSLQQQRSRPDTVIIPEPFWIDPAAQRYDIDGLDFPPEGLSLDSNEVEISGVGLINGRRSGKVFLPKGRYFPFIQYNVLLAHPEGYPDDWHTRYSQLEGVAGRFFRSWAAFYQRCVCSTQFGWSEDTVMESLDGKRFAKLPAISDPSACQWSAYSLYYGRATATDERITMGKAWFGSSGDNPVYPVISDSDFDWIYDEILAGPATPKAPLELSILEKDGGCCDCP